MLNKLCALILGLTLPFIPLQAEQDSHSDSHTPHILSSLFPPAKNVFISTNSLAPSLLLFPLFLIDNTNKDKQLSSPFFVLLGGIYELELSLTLITQSVSPDALDYLTVDVAYSLNNSAELGHYRVAVPNIEGGSNTITLTGKIQVSRSTLTVQVYDATVYSTTAASIAPIQANISIQRLSDDLPLVITGGGIGPAH